jgi:hypothetical protein
MDYLIEIDEIAELDDEFNELQFSSHRSSSQVEAVGFNVAESNNTKPRASQKENRLLSATVGCVSDEVESSLEKVTEKRNAAANEHEEEQESNLLSDLSTQPESVPIQETEDYKHAREFIDPGVAEVDNPVIDESNFVTDTPDTPSTEPPIEEENLSALSQAIDECFREGSGLGVTTSQLLSMLTYVQGLDLGIEQPPNWLLSYPELEPIAALAKHFIESRKHYAAVSLYKGVIKLATRLLNETECISLSLTLNYLHMFCPEYLGHEQAIFQIVIASYLKWQLAADIPPAVTSDRILGVIDCLRSIRNPKSIPMDEAVDRKLLSLNQIIAWPFGRSAYQFRRELLSHALGLANCYSQREEFEAAEALFNFRLGTPSTHGNISYSSAQICKDEQQNYEQHRRRQSSCLYKPRVRPWSTGDLPSLPPNSPSLCKGKIDSLVTLFCQSLIRIRRAKIFQESEAEDHTNRSLLKGKEAVKSIMVDAETNTDFSNNSRQSELSPGRARRAPLLKRKEGLKVVDLESETDTGFTTSSTRSYKYGVTFSDSDVPGIDISRYFDQ